MRLLRRLPKPGTAPGALPEVAPPAVPVRLRLTRYNLELFEEREIESAAELPPVDPSASRWIDVEGHDVGLVAAIGERLALHPLLVEDIINVGQRPKVEAYGDALFLVAEHFFYHRESLELTREQISLVIGDQGLLSVRERPSPLFDPIRRRLEGGRPRIRGGGPGYLAYAVIDTLVDHLFSVLQEIGESIEDLEESLLEGPGQEHLNAVHGLKRDVLLLRKSAWPLREMISSILREHDGLFSDDTRLYLRDVSDHASHAIDIIETYREMVSSLIDLYMSGVSNRMNEVMKVLTIIATIFIPLSFIAGLYGMNFDPSVSPFNMPELGWYWGYPAALLVMLLLAGALLLFFRRKGWI
jgi:magnesium transporter